MTSDYSERFNGFKNSIVNMADGVVEKIANWAAYVAAIFSWLANSVRNFPKKKDFFPDHNGDNSGVKV